MSGADDLVDLAGLERPTVEAVLRRLRGGLASAGAGATAEARTIVGHALGLDLTGLVVGGAREVGAEDLATIVALARRRLAGEPIQRVIGEADFFGRSFLLTPATLTPRPDTETLVETALAELASVSRPIVADLGVGSGAILVTWLAEREDALGVGSDLSEEALATARTNARRHGVADRALFVCGSYASMLWEEGFDAVLSNPPYIASATIETLDAEVRLHDPRLALDGGVDGLDAYRVIAGEARVALKPGGFLAVEIGWDQGAAVAALIGAAGFEGVAVRPDLAGRDRVVVARKPHRATAMVGGAK
ncbi:MAG: peptide chain release factor N(5)-glutamine methyltransferase [Hyphomicrobiales bacterium]|nr:peptide chain release factor N(5)-glutamine methyltransferase [Hyphomicrobiales bacterium]